jgi:hypothetical protein
MNFIASYHARTECPTKIHVILIFSSVTFPPFFLSLHLLSFSLSQEEELSRTAYLSTSEMEAYAENTSSSLLYLTLEAAGVG